MVYLLQPYYCNYFMSVAVIFFFNAISLLRSLMAEGKPTSGIERRMLMKMTTSNSWLVSGELSYILLNKCALSF